MYGFRWRPYVPVAVRRRRAAKEAVRLVKGGKTVSPVVIGGRVIAKSFWGSSWCDNLEGYSDFANRLPRGRTYARNGSVIHLEVARGAIEALVSGSEIYRVAVSVSPLPPARWRAIRKDCSGTIESLVELLQGRLSRGVMERVCRKGTGLFPSPGEIRIRCSCPDWAVLCKHAAAVLYGVGARLDHAPELLFTLRGVDPAELAAGVAEGVALERGGPAAGRTLEGADLSAVFGIEVEAGPVHPAGRKGRRGKPKVAKPKAAKPKTAKPKTAKPKTAKPKTAKPKTAKPKAAKPKAAKKRKPRGRGAGEPGVPGFTAAELRALESLPVELKYSGRARRRSKG